MTIHYRNIARCELCEHRDSHWCQALNHEMRTTLGLVAERAQRHNGKMPDGEVVMDCKSFWRLKRSHGA